ncbi:MAG: UvrD-helicase domain-containing protein [Kocuria sp.]|uniref:UvrD-helicase domain-containing protein n=1 Tax=Kocuria sp. TaxID=1871328 RepID=UPI0026DA7441|nr:UvrD-helicase domain-containing protein [Kocuria sp.]MDO4256340.1 UvrD-helicase domain-containing protein [Kocuria sp.]
MKTWKPNWFARTFMGAGSWSLAIGDGQVRLEGVAEPVVVDARAIRGVYAARQRRQLDILFDDGAQLQVSGARRSWIDEITQALKIEQIENQRLSALLAEAERQGNAARDWLADVHALMARKRWADQDTVARLDRERPGTERWLSAQSEPRLAGAAVLVDSTTAHAVDACRTWNLPAWAEERNARFLEEEKRELAEFFRTVEKSPLTDEQTHATVCFDNRVRVIAAAGSGKTSTMVARAGYAIARDIAQPTEILALAFNRKAAGELSERMSARLGDDGAAVASSTFHAFGLRVIGEATGRKPSLADDLIVDNGLKRLAEVVDALRDHDAVFRRDWDLFRLVFGRQLPDLGDEADPEKSDPRTQIAGFETLAGEIVKSQEEVMIANWLFLNGVNYQYEKPYSHDVADARHRQYQPDFYYPDIDAWHEHWAIGPDGSPPPQFEGYTESMHWRRDTHARYGTTLIETTSASIRDGSGFDHLESELRRRGVELDENPYRESVGEPPITDGAMLRLMRAFLSHAKGNRVSIDTLEQRAGRSLRSKLFVRLYAPILAKWDRRLRAAQQVDFEDMLNLATDHVKAGRWQSPYKVVMVDEMQDTSSARAALVRALAKAPGTYLYAVGDDWQAINRFAGSDLGVMTRFDDWFGQASTIMLARTFRSPQSLCDVAGTFVSKNPGQLPKQVRSSAPDPGATVTALTVRNSEDYANVLQTHLQELDAALDGPATVLVLGRYKTNARDVEGALRARYRNLDVAYNTVHASKGKEADYVVIVAMERGAFPDTREDDPVLQLAMAAPDSHPNAEERRLFYVALTRARRSVLILTRSRRESPFLIELVRDRALSIKSATGEDITPTVCPKCGKRAMVERSGRYGTFLGCSGYPLCKGTSKVARPAI